MKIKKHQNIFPALLTDDFSVIERRLKSVSGVYPIAQVDMCDGVFVPTRTFAGNGLLSDLERLDALATGLHIKLEYDMMVSLEDEQTLRRWLRFFLKAESIHSIVLHIDSTRNFDEIFKTLHDKHILLGLAARLSHMDDEVLRIAGEHPFDYVQLMGIEEIGMGGQKLAKPIFARLENLKTQIRIPIHVDGGVTGRNMTKLFNSGADILAAGSMIFGKA